MTVAGSNETNDLPGCLELESVVGVRFHLDRVVYLAGIEAFSAKSICFFFSKLFLDGDNII